MSLKLQIPFLRSGKFTAKNGKQYAFGKEELEGIAEYDPNLRRAPIVVSHELHGQDEQEILNKKELAFGLVEAVEKAGNYLQATTSKFAPKLQEWISNGNLINVSPKFFGPNDPDNPKPGKYYLRHVALLGSSPPAIEGLPELGFSEAEFGQAGDEGIEFSLSPVNQMARMLADTFRSLRDVLIEKYGLDTADRSIPTYLISSLDDLGRDEEETLSQVLRKAWEKAAFQQIGPAFELPHLVPQDVSMGRVCYRAIELSSL